MELRKSGKELLADPETDLLRLFQRHKYTLSLGTILISKTNFLKVVKKTQKNLSATFFFFTKCARNNISRKWQISTITFEPNTGQN